MRHQYSWMMTSWIALIILLLLILDKAKANFLRKQHPSEIGLLVDKEYYSNHRNSSQQLRSSSSPLTSTSNSRTRNFIYEAESRSSPLGIDVTTTTAPSSSSSTMEGIYVNQSISESLFGSGTTSKRCPQLIKCGKFLDLIEQYSFHRYDVKGNCITRCVSKNDIRLVVFTWFCGACPKNIKVQPSDVQLVPPDGKGPIIAAITAFNWRSDQTWSSSQYELPIYKILDRDKPEFWTYLLDELLLARIDLILLHGRGCWDSNSGTINSTRGTGNMCPRLLKGFLDAVNRAGVQNIVRVGMWDDTGAYRPAKNTIEGNNNTVLFDIANETNWKYFWDYNIKIWFDTIPSNLWFRLDGKPVIASWNLRSNNFINQQGNASRLLSWIRDQFVQRYGVEPAFILERSWMDNDNTITASHAVGQHAWFTPPSRPYSYVDYNGAKWGVTVPGYRGSETTPGCGDSCRELQRNNGALQDQALNAGTGAKLIMLEGWTNMIESAGYYRSSVWRYPCLYINEARKYADPTPETLLFQAEGADDFFDTTSNNIGGAYSDRALDVGTLPDLTGWYVGWIDDGEWLEYKEVILGCGTYRFTARLSTNSDSTKLRLDLPALQSIQPPNTGGNYQLVSLGETLLRAGKYNLRVLFEKGGLNLDYFFLKRVSVC